MYLIFLLSVIKMFMNRIIAAFKKTFMIWKEAVNPFFFGFALFVSIFLPLLTIFYFIVHFMIIAGFPIYITMPTLILFFCISLAFAGQTVENYFKD